MKAGATIPTAFTVKQLDREAPLSEDEWQSFRDGKPTEAALEHFEKRKQAALVRKRKRYLKCSGAFRNINRGY